jgi:hypothetical protein
MITLETLLILPALLAVCLLALVGFGLQRMVNRSGRRRREMAARSARREMLGKFKARLLPHLRPLALRRVKLNQMVTIKRVHHNRKVRIHRENLNIDP